MVNLTTDEEELVKALLRSDVALSHDDLVERTTLNKSRVRNALSDLVDRNIARSTVKPYWHYHLADTYTPPLRLRVAAQLSRLTT